MHELAVATAIARIATHHADGRPVEVVAVRVGRLRAVVPDSLRFCFGIVTREGACAGARLELEEVPLRLRCGACPHEWEPREPIFRCPRCDEPTGEILAGEELEVQWIELGAPAGAAASEE